MGAKRTYENANVNGGGTVSVGASTSVVVSKAFPIQSDGLSIRVAIKVASATKTNGITFKLQTSSMLDDATPAQPLWEDATGLTATISASSITQATVITIAGSAYNSGQTAAFPLGLQGQIVCTTGASDACVVESVRVLTPAH